MSVYLDASVLLALFTNDAHTGRANALLRRHTPVVIVSDFAAAEFASAIARRVRTKDLTAQEARSCFSTFDAWTAQATSRAEMTAADVSFAIGLLRRLDLTLRTPDALNIAIVQRVGADLFTFDQRMARVGRTLGVGLVGP